MHLQQREVTNVHVYKVPSFSKPDLEYEVILGEGFGRCSCPDNRYRQAGCKHLDEVYDDWREMVGYSDERAKAEHPFAKLRVPDGAEAILTGPVRADLYREES